MQGLDSLRQRRRQELVVRRRGVEDPRRGLGVWVEWVLDYRLDFELSSENNSWDLISLGWV